MTDAYDPKGNSLEKATRDVSFTETAPPEHLRGVVHRFLEVRTTQTRAEDYRFHALPDACTYVIFDQSDPAVAGVTKLRASAEELNLGRRFHFVNIRFLPGVWDAKRIAPDHGQIDSAYDGPLPLLDVGASLAGLPFVDQVPLLVRFAERLLSEAIVTPNPATEAIFAEIDDIHTVADMADLCALSPRQLQRTLKRTTGLTPHDFLKVLRLQQALRGEPSLSYADQSHFIHSFRKATGYTPGNYAAKFD